MDEGKVINDLLENDAAVGTEIDDRIYPGVGPQDPTMPYCTYQKSSDRVDGQKDSDSILDESTWDIDIFAKDYSQMVDAAIAIRNALDRFSGTNNEILIDQINFRRSVELSEFGNETFQITQQYDIRRKYTP